MGKWVASHRRNPNQQTISIDPDDTASCAPRALSRCTKLRRGGQISVDACYWAWKQRVSLQVATMGWARRCEKYSAACRVSQRGEAMLRCNGSVLPWLNTGKNDKFYMEISGGRNAHIPHFEVTVLRPIKIKPGESRKHETIKTPPRTSHVDALSESQDLRLRSTMHATEMAAGSMAATSILLTPQQRQGAAKKQQERQQQCQRKSHHSTSTAPFLVAWIHTNPPPSGATSCDIDSCCNRSPVQQARVFTRSVGS